MHKKFFIIVLLTIGLPLALTRTVFAEPVDTEITVTSGTGDSELRQGTYGSSGTTGSLGKPSNQATQYFMLFEDIPVGQGGTINSAHLELTMTASGGNVVNVLIGAYDSVTPTVPTDAAEFSTYASNLLSTTVEWNSVPTGAWGTILESPDLTTMLQELIDDPSWEFENDVLIWIGNNNSDDWSSRTFVTSEFSGVNEPKPTLVINYEQVNLAPSAVNDEYSLSTTALLSVLSNDSDPEGGALTLDSVSDPAHGTATISDGKIQYVPDSGYVGEDAFTYTISDPGSNTANATVTINVLENPYYYSIDFDIDATGAPDLYWDTLTYEVKIGTADFVSASIDGQNVSTEYDATSGNVYFSGNGTAAEVIFKNPLDTGILTAGKAALKDGKHFAWSHSMDDNVLLQAQIDLINAKGWTGGVNIIGEIVQDERNESWILDKPGIHQVLLDGWGVGNHGWDSHCAPPNDDWEGDILDGYNRLHGIIADSEVPEYKLIGFAAPCFLEDYDAFITSHRTNSTTEVQFNQSQGSGVMHITEGASGYSSGTISATAVSSNTVKIGRDLGIETSASNAIAFIEWMGEQSTVSRNFWYNTLSHGEKEGVLGLVLDYAYDNYGPGGTDVIWVASPEEIYSYLLTRDNTDLLNITTTQLSDGTDPTQSNVSLSTTSTTSQHTWNTSRAASTLVRRGTNSQQLFDSSELNTNPRVTSHSLTLSSLQPCTKYYYQLVNTDAYEAEAESAISNFTTSGCSQQTSLAELQETVISSGTTSKQTLNFTDSYSVHVQFGVDDVGSDLTLQVKKLENTSNINVSSSDKSIVRTNVYEVNAFNGITPVASFSDPVTIDFTYLDSDVSGLNESSLQIYRYDENADSWVGLSNCSVDTGSNTVSCTTTQFSLFSLFGSTSGGSSSSSGSSSSASSSGSDSHSQCEKSVGDQAPWLYTAIPQGATRIELYFTDVNDPYDHYALEFGTSSADYQWGAENIGGKGTRTYTVESLSPETTYYFRVRSGNGCAPGNWSNVLSATTPSRFSDLTTDSLETKIVDVGLSEVSQLDKSLSEITGVSDCQIHIVKSGDTLADIAEETLGSASKYPRLVELNQKQYPSLEKNAATIEVGWELLIAECGDNRDGREAEKAIGQAVKITLTDANKKPVVGATVTLHSTPRETKTDENGIAYYEDVEPGEHRIVIAYNDQVGEQHVFIPESEDVGEVSFAVEMRVANPFANPLVIGVVGTLVVILLLMAVLIVRKR